MEQLDDIIRRASERVGDNYFSLPVENGDDAQLERIYCYELYHQMRDAWPKPCPFTLSAEVDKRRHPIIGALDGGRVIPDLLVHTPGSMAGNHAIIEVKRAETTTTGIRKDLATLTRFMGPDIGYARGIYIVFGGFDPRAIKRAIGQRQYDPRIEVWLHDKVGTPASLALTLAELATIEEA